MYLNRQQIEMGALTLLALILVPVKLLYSFFLFANVVDVLLFISLGFGIRRWTSLRSVGWGMLIALPTLMMTLTIARNIGFAQIKAGIGTGWLVASLVIPLALGIGLSLGKSQQLSLR